jgi:outer membrane lipoprotein-sorting protein
MAIRILRNQTLKCFVAVATTVVICPSPARAQSGEQILQKTRDAYLTIKSYADTGTILEEYGTDSKSKHTFATYFNRAPRHFLLEFTKEGGDKFVIWGDPDAFHTWWKTTGQLSDYPNPQNIPAISLSEYNTKGASMKVPTLLYGKSQLAAVMLAITDPTLDGTDEIVGHHCFRVTGRMSDVYRATGKEVNIHRETLWIDADSYLVRQVREEWKAMPGQIHRTTTAYQPQANPNLDESKFKFIPPESK